MGSFWDSIFLILLLSSRAKKRGAEVPWTLSQETKHAIAKLETQVMRNLQQSGGD